MWIHHLHQKPKKIVFFLFGATVTPPSGLLEDFPRHHRFRTYTARTQRKFSHLTRKIRQHHTQMTRMYPPNFALFLLRDNADDDRRRSLMRGRRKNQDESFDNLHSKYTGLAIENTDTNNTLFPSQKLYKNYDILGIAETNIDWQDSAIYHRTRQTIIHIYQRAHQIGSFSQTYVKGD